jgi:hypothetical protein
MTTFAAEGAFHWGVVIFFAILQIFVKTHDDA